MTKRTGRTSLMLVCGLACFVASTNVNAQQARPRLQEPVYRVSDATAARKEGRVAAHPLDKALDMAREGLRRIQSEINDYSCTIVKRERVKGEVGDYEYMFTKIRNERKRGNTVVTPFSAYLYFLKPDNIKGREVVYVKGANNGKMMAHEGGTAGKLLPSVWIRPEGPLAMRGNRYPITELGIENLVRKLLERGAQDRKDPEVQVRFHKNAKINGRLCTLIEIKHPVRREQHDFYVAHVFIDDELRLPIRYAAYDWPKTAGGRPEVIEEYTYLNIKLNVGLTAEDFNPDNSNYSF